MFGVILSGCDAINDLFGGGSDPDDKPLPSGPPAITDPDEVKDYLDSAPENPVDLRVDMELPADWPALLAAIAEAGKNVNLDLSACTMTGETGEFDPNAETTDNGGKDKIVSLVLPAGATSIKASDSPFNSTFLPFSELKSVSGESVETIGNFAFTYHPTLTEASFPAAKTIGTGAFSDCAALTTVNFPVAETIGYAAFGGSGLLSTVDFPAVTTIDHDAFSYCIGLTSAILPAAASFGDHVFQATESKALVVTLGDTVPTLGKGTFDDFGVGVAKTVTVKVPASAATAYGASTEGTTYSGNNEDLNWGNGFRGGGWTDQEDFAEGGTVNSSITLTITAE
jgi:hypothetical protein